jgi:hypothetical protein
VGLSNNEVILVWWSADCFRSCFHLSLHYTLVICHIISL